MVRAQTGGSYILNSLFFFFFFFFNIFSFFNRYNRWWQEMRGEGRRIVDNINKLENCNYIDNSFWSPSSQKCALLIGSLVGCFYCHCAEWAVWDTRRLFSHSSESKEVSMCSLQMFKFKTRTYELDTVN